MPINKITAKEWSDLLQDASKPPKQKEGLPVTKYLVRYRPEEAKTMDEYSFKVVTSDELKSGEEKLSLGQITALSKGILNNDKKITDKQQAVIIDKVEQMAQAKLERLQEARISRGILRAISYLLFATILGIAWGWLIKVELDASEEEINTAYHLREAAYFNSVDEQISIENDPTMTPFGRIAQGTRDEINMGLSGDGMLNRFKDDYKRTHMHMLVKEKEKTLLNHKRVIDENITDKLAHDLAKKEFNKLHSLFRKEDDSKWLSFLQLVFTQLTERPLFGNLKGHCLALSPDIESNRYELEPIAPEKIQVTIVRNGEKIEKLRVEAKSITAFFHKFSLTNGETHSERVPGKKIQSDLQFEITLNSQKEPEVTVTKYHHKLISK